MEREGRTNRVSPEIRDLLTKNPMVILRDKRTLKPLGVSFTEEGLKGIANKNGVYLYCKGRVTNFIDAKKAKINDNVLVERFIPREFNNPGLATAEIHWAKQARHLLGKTY